MKRCRRDINTRYSCECAACRVANRREMMYYYLVLALPVVVASDGVSLEGKHLRVTTSRVNDSLDLV